MDPATGAKNYGQHPSYSGEKRRRRINITGEMEPGTSAPRAIDRRTLENHGLEQSTLTSWNSMTPPDRSCRSIRRQVRGSTTTTLVPAGENIVTNGARHRWASGAHKAHIPGREETRELLERRTMCPDRPDLPSQLPEPRTRSVAALRRFQARAELHVNKRTRADQPGRLDGRGTCRNGVFIGVGRASVCQPTTTCPRPPADEVLSDPNVRQARSPWANRPGVHRRGVITGARRDRRLTPLFSWPPGTRQNYGEARPMPT